MTNKKQTMFESLGEINEYCSDYQKYIVTEKQVELINEIYSELEDLNAEIWVKRYYNQIWPIEMETIINGSFDGANISEILYEHGCNYLNELTIFESFKSKYETLTNLNTRIVKHGLYLESIDHTFW